MHEDDRPRQVKLLSRVIWVGGLLLTLALGVVARQQLQAAGIAVVTWRRGATLILPLALWAEIPYLVLAYIVRRVLRGLSAEETAEFAKWRLVSLGAFAGVMTVVGGQLFGMLSYHGPGGFAEVVIMTLAMSPLTIPVLLLWSAGGAALGGALGWGLWWVWRGRR